MTVVRSRVREILWNMRRAPAAARRRALARAITLLESTRLKDQKDIELLLQGAGPMKDSSLRLGVTGPPGVGKSTFIEALGSFLAERGRRVAVLAVDPSSARSGGAVLADKTRMTRLAAHPLAFVRPSPSGRSSGGLAERTREAVRLCEAAGYDVVIVETVGTGQNEIAVAGVTDMVALMEFPNAGDGYQAIKRGALEWADFVLVNKADVDPSAAERARDVLFQALSLGGGRHDRPRPPVVLVLSASRGDGVEGFWDEVERIRNSGGAREKFHERRRSQNVAWMWERLNEAWRDRLATHPGVRAAASRLEKAVADGGISPPTAARRLLSSAIKPGSRR